MMVSPHVRNPMRSLAGILVVSLLAPLVPATGASAALPAYNPLTSATKIAVSKETLSPFLDKDFDKPKLSPKTNKHFDIVDPATKKSVDPDTTITAPSGTKIRAGDYYKHVNDLEDDLGSRGQSLRDGTSFELGTLHGGHQDDLKPTISRAPQIKGQYNATTGSDRLNATRDTSKNVKPVTKPDDDDSAIAAEVAKLNAQVNAMQKQQAIQALPYGYKSAGLKPIAPPPAAPEPASPTKTSSYSETDGTKSLAAIALSGSVTSEAKGHVGHLLSNESLSVYLFGHNANIVSATADVNPKTANFVYSALGDTFANYSGPIHTSFDVYAGGHKSVSFFDFSIPITVSIFTVTLGASAGAEFAGNGAAGGAGSLTGHPGFVQMSSVESANVIANFSVSIGVGDTSGSFGFGLAAGIDGSLTVASFTMPLYGYAEDYLTMRRTGSQKTDKNIYGCYLTFYGLNDGQLDYAFLSGSVSFFLKGCFIFCATVLNVHIFSWDGITGKDTLFNQKIETPGSAKYSDLADYGVPDPGTTYSKDGSTGMPQACEALRNDQQQNGSSS